MINELNLGHCVNNQVSELSGGELQRLSIAAASVKDADVYFFDEPTSYLDVKQRLKVTELIRNLGAYVIVVEHDTETMENAVQQ